MSEITVQVDSDNKVPRHLLQTKLDRLKERGLMDAGVVLVQNGGYLQGYLGQAELEFGLKELGRLYPVDGRVRLLGDDLESELDVGQFGDGERGGDVEDGNGAREVHVRFPSKNGSGGGSGSGSGSDDERGEAASGDLDLSSFVDRTPISLSDKTPMEYAIECFGKLGLRHLMITEEGTGKLKGVCLKKRVIQYIEGLHDGGHD